MSIRSIGETFNPKGNSLNTLRLVFASLVIVSHSYPIGGFGNDPAIGDFTLGHFAVAAFFVASGYLIASSRVGRRTTLASFAWARVLRIYPAFWVCLLVTAFVAAPVAAITRGGWSLGSATTYLTGNFTLRIHHYPIGETLAGAPYPLAWNGSLWTLYYEFGCYVIIGLFLSVPLFRRGGWLTALFVAATAASLARQLGHLGDLESQKALWALLVPFFLAGAVLHQQRHRVPSSPLGAIFSAAVIAISTALGWGEFVAPLPLAYLVMWLATSFPRTVERWRGGDTDISYGMYVYAFPVQQLLVLAGVHHLGAGPMIVASLVATTIPASASWFGLERWLHRHRHKFQRPDTCYQPQGSPSVPSSR